MEKEFISRDDQEENWKQSGFLGLFEQSFLYRSKQLYSDFYVQEK